YRLDTAVGKRSPPSAKHWALVLRRELLEQIAYGLADQLLALHALRLPLDLRVGHAAPDDHILGGHVEDQRAVVHHLQRLRGGVVRRDSPLGDRWQELSYRLRGRGRREQEIVGDDERRTRGLFQAAPRHLVRD